MVQHSNSTEGQDLKLIATLSYFNEEPKLLTECVRRLTDVGVDLLVAVDGPYDLYPTDKTSSDFETAKAIIDACGGSDQPDLIMRNKSGWSGNEVEKRNYMLSIALAVAQEGDWLLVVDSDHMWEMIEPANGSLKDWLSLPMKYDVAEVGIADCSDVDGELVGWYEARLLNRAVPGMAYEGAHWRIRFPDGRSSATLRAGARDGDKEVLDLTAVARVRHVVYADELTERRKRQTAYYERRDGEGVEA